MKVPGDYLFPRLLPACNARRAKMRRVAGGNDLFLAFSGHSNLCMRIRNDVTWQDA